MMWDFVMEHVKILVNLDATLSDIFVGNFRKSGPSDFQVPVLEWTLLADTESEIWSPMLVQFDIWTRKAEDTRRAERRLRSMFHQTTSITFDTYTMLTEYADGVDLATPSRSNLTGRGLRFRMSPLRQVYALPGLDS